MIKVSIFRHGLVNPISVCASGINDDFLCLDVSFKCLENEKILRKAVWSWMDLLVDGRGHQYWISLQCQILGILFLLPLFGHSTKVRIYLIIRVFSVCFLCSYNWYVLILGTFGQEDWEIEA